MRPICLPILLLAALCAVAQPVFPIKNGRLQSPLDAAGQPIINVPAIKDMSGNSIVGGSLGSLTNGIIWVSSTQGSDANPGTVDRPLLTVEAADARAQAGATVNVGRGQYVPAAPLTNALEWVLASDTILGSTNVVAYGPVFYSTNNTILISGGNVECSEQALVTEPDGNIVLDRTRVIPSVNATNNVNGAWFE